MIRACLLFDVTRQILHKLKEDQSMKAKMQKDMIRRDKDGYEYGGPDLTKMRSITGEEREQLLKRARQESIETDSADRPSDTKTHSDKAPSRK